MSLISQADPTIKNSALIVIGVIAGGITAYFTDGILPPSAVFAVFFILLLARQYRK